jgi:putative transcriptional regulator
MGLSQAGFAAHFGLPLHTLRNWEQGKRTPDPAALAYLKVIEKAPDMVTGILAE